MSTCPYCKAITEVDKTRMSTCPYCKGDITEIVKTPKGNMVGRCADCLATFCLTTFLLDGQLKPVGRPLYSVARVCLSRRLPLNEKCTDTVIRDWEVARPEMVNMQALATEIDAVFKRYGMDVRSDDFEKIIRAMEHEIDSPETLLPPQEKSN